nr:Chain C, 8-mer peptide from interacting protein (liprin)1N7F_D Chain D, 8-mer peptide from interacting protein (liprin)
ATVRTYSC